eukprot:1822463-Amphidinium_carterae.1
MAREELDKAQAAQLRGRVHFCQSQMWSRAGGVILFALDKRCCEDEVAVTGELRRALVWIL